MQHTLACMFVLLSLDVLFGSVSYAEESKQIVLSANIPRINDHSEMVIKQSDLIPGTKQLVHLHLRNETTQDLQIKEIKSSCGCMVIGQVLSKLPKDEILKIPLNYTVPEIVGETARQLTLTSNNGDRWTFTIVFASTTPLLPDSTNYKIENNKQHKDFLLKVSSNPNFKTSTAIDFFKNLQCGTKSPTIKIDGISRKPQGDCWEISFSVSTRHIPPGSKSDALVTIFNDNFSVSIPVQIHAPPQLRSLPKEIARSDLQNGANLVISAHSDTANIEVVARGKNGNSIPISIDRISETKKVLVAKISCESRYISEIQELKISEHTENNDSELVVSLLD